MRTGAPESLGDLPPAEFEQVSQPSVGVSRDGGTHVKSSPENPVRFSLKTKKYAEQWGGMSASRPSDSIVFELSELERGIVDLIPGMPPPPRWPAFNAIRHLNRGWRLRELDPAMAFFRAITAEEEAATALFWSLKKHRYKGADRLSHRNHEHKNALFPFMEAASRVFARVGSQMPETQFLLDTNATKPRLQLQVRLPHPETRELTWGSPDPPLNFAMTHRLGAKTESQPIDFSAEMAQVAKEADAKSVANYLQERANRRNQLLYAGPEGYPDVEGDIDAGLRLAQRNVFAILMVYLFVDPYSEHQKFVQQSLTSFLKVLDAVRGKASFD